MTIIELIETIAATAGKNAKTDLVMNAFLAGEREFFVGARLAYDTSITFGVKKVPNIDEAEDASGTFSFNDFLALTNKLRLVDGKRALSGHAARDALIAAAESCDTKMWNLFYRRVLMKDLGIGLTESTINKALEKLIKKGNTEAGSYIIPVFECQLAENGDNEPHIKKVRGIKMLDIKLDGVRLLGEVNKEKRTVTLYQREGQINENFPHIQQAMMALIDLLPGSVMFDGEVVTNSFQDLMSRFRKKGSDTSMAKLALFDVVPLSDFYAGHCMTPQKDRHAILSAMQTGGLFAKANDALFVIPKITVDLDTPEGQHTLAEFNRQALIADYEGIMIKDPNAPYVTSRNDGWLKKKPKISVTLEIIGFELGDPDGKFAKCLGAFICSGEENGLKIKTKCGGGFTPAQRQQFWDDRQNLLGMMIEVEGDKLTLNDSGDGTYSVRFPVMKDFRGTVPGEVL